MSIPENVNVTGAIEVPQGRRLPDIDKWIKGNFSGSQVHHPVLSPVNDRNMGIIPGTKKILYRRWNSYTNPIPRVGYPLQGNALTGTDYVWEKYNTLASALNIEGGAIQNNNYPYHWVCIKQSTNDLFTHPQFTISVLHDNNNPDFKLLRTGTGNYDLILPNGYNASSLLSLGDTLILVAGYRNCLNDCYEAIIFDSGELLGSCIPTPPSNFGDMLHCIMPVKIDAISIGGTSSTIHLKEWPLPQTSLYLIDSPDNCCWVPDRVGDILPPPWIDPATNYGVLNGLIYQLKPPTQLLNTDVICLGTAIYDNITNNGLFHKSFNNVLSYHTDLATGRAGIGIPNPLEVQGQGNAQNGTAINPRWYCCAFLTPSCYDMQFQIRHNEYITHAKWDQLAEKYIAPTFVPPPAAGPWASHGEMREEIVRWGNINLSSVGGNVNFDHHYYNIYNHFIDLNMKNTWVAQRYHNNNKRCFIKGLPIFFIRYLKKFYTDSNNNIFDYGSIYHDPTIKGRLNSKINFQALIDNVDISRRL